MKALTLLQLLLHHSLNPIRICTKLPCMLLNYSQRVLTTCLPVILQQKIRNSLVISAYHNHPYISSFVYEQFIVMDYYFKTKTIDKKGSPSMFPHWFFNDFLTTFNQTKYFVVVIISLLLIPLVLLLRVREDLVVLSSPFVNYI